MTDSRITEALNDAQARADLRAAATRAAREAGVRITLPRPTAVTTVATRPQSVDSAQMAQPSQPSPAPATFPATEGSLSALIDTLLPQILGAISAARAAYGDRKLSLSEAKDLGLLAITVISTAVQKGAPLVKGADARALVIALFSVIYDRYAAELLPEWVPAGLRPLVLGAVKAAAIRGLEAAYTALVKPKK